MIFRVQLNLKNKKCYNITMDYTLVKQTAADLKIVKNLIGRKDTPPKKTRPVQKRVLAFRILSKIEPHSTPETDVFYEEKIANLETLLDKGNLTENFKLKEI